MVFDWLMLQHRKMSSLALTKPRADFVIVQRWYRLAKLLGFTPISTENSERKLWNYWAIVYPVLLLIIYLGGTIFSFYERFRIYESFNLSQTILDILQGIVESVFIEHAVIWSLLNKKHWNKMMRSIEQLEQKLHWTCTTEVTDYSTAGLRLRIFFYHAVYAAVHIYDSIVNWMFLSYSLAFIIFRFTTYYIMFTTLFIDFVCTWARNRYLYMHNYLRVYGTARNIKFSIVQKEHVLSKLAEFSNCYKHLFLIVEEINTIFGTYFFFVAICTVLEVLNAVNYGMPSKNQDIDQAVTGVNVLFLALYIICNVQIVMACNSVLKCAKSIQKTCLILHEQMENRELREEFLRLSYYVQGRLISGIFGGRFLVGESVDSLDAFLLGHDLSDNHNSIQHDLKIE
ncbi:hypothetical protein HUJ05_006372 [Dendroctonus ponderosae]|nr:hypothetical protein HUJ05_006372 [Dendroctonus ponderosae]